MSEKIKIYPDDDFPLREKLNCIIPVTIVCREDEVKILAYPDFSGIAEEYARKFSGNLLDETALKWLDDAVRPLIQSLGYDRDEDAVAEWYCNFVAEGADDINQAVIQFSSQVNGMQDVVENLTCFEADEDTNCVTILENKIVSCAAVNTEMDEDEDGSISIGVETAETYRGNGYAASNTAKLNQFLLEQGYRQVKYECSCANSASVQTAKKSGMRLVGKTYYYVAYQIDEMDE